MIVEVGGSDDEATSTAPARSEAASDDRTRAVSATEKTLKCKLQEKTSIIKKLRSALRKKTNQVKSHILSPKNKKSSKSQLQMVLREQAVGTQHGNSFEIVKAGRMLEGRAGRLTQASVFAIGLRRSLSNVAAADFGLVSCCDISGQTVSRCEEKTATGVSLLVRDFCQEVYHTAKQVSEKAAASGTALWSVACIGYRSDSTNSRIWKRQKLHVVECSVSFVKDFGLWKAGEFAKAVATRSCVTPGRIAGSISISLSIKLLFTLYQSTTATSTRT